MKNYVNRLAFLLAVVMALVGFNAEAATKAKSNAGKDKGQTDELQAKTLRGVYDLQQNTVSNVQFYTTNYGIFGLNVAQSGGIGGGYWPRGSVNQYIFGGGVWFAAQKQNPAVTNEVQYRKYVEVTYNPNSGLSWMVPGRIEDGDLVDPNDIDTYRTYFSIDFKADGTPLEADKKANWPIWDASRETKDTLKKNRYFGYFIKDTKERNRSTYPKGPAYISEEDIFSTFKDTDLNRFEGGVAQRKKEGYPLRLQFEHTIYSWGFGDYRDFIFLRYDITNRSTDTLRECWLAPVMDVDIAVAPNTRRGADNDRVRTASDTTLNLAYQWTNPDLGERGRGFGYLGFDFLESPAVQIAYRTDYVKDSLGNVVDSIKTPIIKEGYSGFIRKDAPFYPNSEQLGLRTFRNWSIDDDKLTDEARYDFMSLGQREGETGPGDKRFMMATGPFHMRPNDTVRVIVGVILANTAKGGDADGTDADIAELIRKDKFAQAVYDNNFQAPMPPDASVIKSWKPLNNAVSFTWDSTAELTVDPYENGLDFMGFRIYRARRTNLDTFDVNIIEGNNQYPSGKGPLGWKELASYSMRPPFWKSGERAGRTNSSNMPFIDQIWVLGPQTIIENGVPKIDTMSIRVMRIPFGTNPIPENVVYQQTGIWQPVLTGIDTSALSRPWGPYFNKLAKEGNLNFNATIADKLHWTDWGKNIKLFDSALVGTVKLNSALMEYNPMFFRKFAEPITLDSLDSLFDKYPNGIVGPITIIPAYTDSKGVVHPEQRIRTSIDKIFIEGSVRNLNNGYIIDVLRPRPINQIMNDPSLLMGLQDEIYTWVQNGYAKMEFPQIEESADVRYNYIAPYMREITNNRTFTDIGDDNHNGYVDLDENPMKTEKLINNLDYYYKVLAFDEGDYNQPTPMKLNSAQEGRPNFVQTTPKSAPVGSNSQFKITISPQDSAKLGGIYNFQAFPVDQERVNQLLSGHTLQLEFQPVWQRYTAKFPGRSETDALKFGLYQQRLKLTDLTTGKELYNTNYMFELQPCNLSFREAFTENAGSYIWADSAIIDPIHGGAPNTFGLRENRESLLRSGKFTTGNFRDQGYCYTNGFNQDVYGALGFSFDYTMKQFGGWYRPDSASLDLVRNYAQNKGISTQFGLADDRYTDDIILKTQEVAYDYYYNALLAAGFNNGPGEYELEFLPGGTETMTVEYGEKGKKKQATFNVPYLNVRMRNIATYNRPMVNDVNDSVLVSYPLEMPHITLPMAPYELKNPITGETILDKRMYPDPRNLLINGAHYDSLESNQYIGKFNIAASGFVNARNYNLFKKDQYVARPIEYKNEDFTYVGTQGRYYLSATNGQDTIDFSHVINVGGVNFGLTYANVWTTSWGLNFGTAPKKGEEKVPLFGKDFQEGDKITFKTIGGAQGMPLPGTKILISVTPFDTTTQNITDEMMDGVGVTPNPYVISHIGQSSPYDSKIYFTKLPSRCTIEIYTVAGDLVRKLDHDAFSSPLGSRESVEVWDLLTVNGTRSASQAFVAVITTPDGAQTHKTFSVILGGFRLSSEE